MQYFKLILLICSLSVAICHPQLKKREDDDEERKHDRLHHKGYRPSTAGSLFDFSGGDDEDENPGFFTDSFKHFNNLMKSFSDMFQQHIDRASSLLNNWGKGGGFTIDMDDITKNSTVNSSESHTEQVGKNYVTTNITRLDKVDKNGKKYRIIHKNVRVKPVNGTEDILNSDRTYVIMDSDKGAEPNFSETPREHRHKPSEDKPEILPKTSTEVRPKASTEILPKTLTENFPKTSTEILPSTSTEKFEGEKENTDVTPAVKPSKRPWEKVDPNVMFDSRKNEIVTDLESNDV